MTKLIAASALVIEQNIPLPPRKTDKVAKVKSPEQLTVANRIRQMKRGDSLFVTPDQSVGGKAIYVVSRSTNRKFATRTETKGGVKGTRIWRMK